MSYQRAKWAVSSIRFSLKDRSLTLWAYERVVGNGSNYRGFQGKTISGYICKPWEISDSSNGVDISHNYCRNPDGSKGIWCYTGNKTFPRDFCEPISNTKIKFPSD